MGWQIFCGDFVAPERSKWASLRSRANFYTHAGRDQAADLLNRRPSKLPLEPLASRTATAQMEDIIRRPVTKNRRYFPSIRSHNDHRTPAPWRNASCASL